MGRRSLKKSSNVHRVLELLEESKVANEGDCVSSLVERMGQLEHVSSVWAPKADKEAEGAQNDGEMRTQQLSFVRRLVPNSVHVSLHMKVVQLLGPSMYVVMLKPPPNTIEKQESMETTAASPSPSPSPSLTYEEMVTAIMDKLSLVPTPLDAEDLLLPRLRRMSLAD